MLVSTRDGWGRQTPCRVCAQIFRSLGCADLMTPVQVGPIYLAEMAPAKLRGTLNVLFQLMVTIGALLTMVTFNIVP